MDLDAGSLLTSMLVSSVGFVLLVYGRKMARLPHVTVGAVLLIFPYFVGSIFTMLAVALALCLVLWFAVQRGY
jgi:hypothetical protein